MYVCYWCAENEKKGPEVYTDKMAHRRAGIMGTPYKASPSESLWLVPGTWEHLLEVE